MAYDGTENVSAAYGYYIDDFQWPSMGAIFAVKGNKHSPFAGYYIGRDRITVPRPRPCTAIRVPARTGIAYHWRIQPVILVAEDGRSANLRTRLFEPVTGKTTERPTTIISGMYPNDQTVLEEGHLEAVGPGDRRTLFHDGRLEGRLVGREAQTSRIARVRLPARWCSACLAGHNPDRDGCKGAAVFAAARAKPSNGRVSFRCGSTTGIPSAVDGHSIYWPDCVPCELRPESQMTRHGYLMPPAGPTGKAKP